MQTLTSPLFHMLAKYTKLTELNSMQQPNNGLKNMLND
jgi:hypothetical protein